MTLVSLSQSRAFTQSCTLPQSPSAFVQQVLFFKNAHSIIFRTEVWSNWRIPPSGSLATHRDATDDSYIANLVCALGFSR
jgi:hypothetical protein